MQNNSFNVLSMILEIHKHYFEDFYLFSQGLHLQQIDMMDDSIAARSANKMATKIGEVCVMAIERMRRHTGQQIDGRQDFFVIDQSHFWHKRKVCFTNSPFK